jgi:phosphoribosylformylglycinamidine synthase subunit PurQ / glutaminase
VKWGVVTFPGSLDDRDTLHALRDVLEQDAESLWHKDRDLRGVDCVVLPGGFSYGDYLRCGAMARFSPIMESVMSFARRADP